MGTIWVSTPTWMPSKQHLWFASKSAPTTQHNGCLHHGELFHSSLGTMCNGTVTVPIILYLGCVCHESYTHVYKRFIVHVMSKSLQDSHSLPVSFPIVDVFTPISTSGAPWIFAWHRSRFTIRFITTSASAFCPASAWEAWSRWNTSVAVGFNDWALVLLLVLQ